MDNISSRAKKMAEQYGNKLKALSQGKSTSRVIRQPEQQTPNQIENLKKAKAKLQDFIDLI